MKNFFLVLLLVLTQLNSNAWGFYAHRRINYYAVFLLPPEMLLLYKSHIGFLEEHAVDPDKRRYAVNEEGPRHYIDLDRYGSYPYDSLPRSWSKALQKYGDSLQTHGIVPWWLQTMLHRLTNAFREKNLSRILKYSAEIGHYISDAHVPLHASSNHNGQYTGQKGIHGFWESRIPELLAETTPGWDFLLGRAAYLKDPGSFFWSRVLESAAAADTVLRVEKQLSYAFPGDRRYAFEERNGVIIRQYSAAYTMAYNERLHGMVERRMRQSIYAVASCWFTAWVNAGQPRLDSLMTDSLSPEERTELEELNRAWRNNPIKGREHD